VAIQKTEAIVLRRQEVRETSLMLTAYSRHLGKFQGLVKGVRGSRAAVPWYLEPLTLQSVVLYERRRSPWVLVSACDLLDGFEPVRRDLARTAYATYMLDLVDSMTGFHDPHPEIFEALLSVLRGLESPEADPATLARFLEIHLLRASGLLPKAEALAVPPAVKEAFRKLLNTPFSQAAGLRLDRETELPLRRLLQGLVRRALERDLRSRSFLHAIGLDAA
jgi:DNA repair protein RecO (recombination protein O)